MLKKLWKWNAKIGGKLVNVDPDAEWEDLKQRWKGMRKSPKEFVRLYIEKVKENFSNHPKSNTTLIIFFASSL